MILIVSATVSGRIRACVRTAYSLGTAHHTQIPQLYGVLVYHAPELGLLAPARGQTPRTRTAINSTDNDLDIRLDHILASSYSRTPIRCRAFTMLAHITQCVRVPNL
jgi:hypothetical protein